MKRCLYAGALGLPPELGGFLEERGIEFTYNPLKKPLGEGDLVSMLKDYDGVLAGGEPYTEKVLASAPKLKIIARTGVGYDQIDVAAATRHGVVITTTPIPELSYAVAELAIGHMLASVKRIPQLNRAIRRGEWNRQNWTQEVGDAYHPPLGPLGAGRIGFEVAKRAKALGLGVIYYDVVRMAQVETEAGAEFVTLDQLLSRADVISIHTPLTPQTTGMVNAEFLGKMKKTAILINTARGKIVDERALADALKEGRIGGACLDVLNEEPPTEKSPFYRLGDDIPNLVLTPHAANGPHTFGRMAMTAAADVAKVLEGGRPSYPLNKEVLDQPGR
ncbi:MAG: phosphoglycerate dehydrogenase [Nitrososphaerota archaeon]|nr:phosphoglycerate dehydrogenase [Nitrososphaerota archaeon]